MSKRMKRWANNPTENVVDLNSAAKSRARQSERLAAKERRKKKGSSLKAKKQTNADFYRTPEWKRARYKALKKSDGRCECCGAGKPQGAVLNVDHIKPLHRYPELALRQSNLQVLCGSCNQGKGARDETDWRRG